MKKSLGKYVALVLALSMVAFLGVGCDGIGGRVSQESVMGVGQTMAARLYYPSNISAPTGATTMTGGFMETLEMVSWLSVDLAEAGYVVLAFTPANIMGMVNQWKNAHKNCINRLKQINSSHRTLAGKIDLNKLSTCGHSKGGGGSLWAASELRDQLATAVGMAPWMEGFTGATLRSITAPTLIQAGGADTLAIGSMTRSEYNGVGASQKCYAQYPGYSHMAWAMASGSRAQALGGDIISWMNYYMNNTGSVPSRCR